MCPLFLHNCACQPFTLDAVLGALTVQTRDRFLTARDKLVRIQQTWCSFALRSISSQSNALDGIATVLLTVPPHHDRSATKPSRSTRQSGPGRRWRRKSGGRE